jgi:hypothetical protein
MKKIYFIWLIFASICMATKVAIAQLDTSQIEAITVRIDVKGGDKEEGGSGVIVHKQGQLYTILTAYHVVEKRKNYTISIFNYSSRKLIPSYDINYDSYDINYHRDIRRIKNYDLAEIKIVSSSSYITANIGDSLQLKKTDPVTIFGYPLPTRGILKRGSDPDIVSGEISSILPLDRVLKGGASLQIDKVTKVGMSGGAVVNKNGELVGILSEADPDVYGVTSSLAIPINLYDQWQVIRNSQTPRPANLTLEQLLFAKKWGEANDKTWEVLLKESDANNDGKLNSFEVENLSCKTLMDLDIKWSRASSGEYGFRVQRGIYSASHGDWSRDKPESNIYKYTEFAKKVGWFNTVEEISEDIPTATLYSQKKPNRGFYPIWFVSGKTIGKLPFGLPVPIRNDYNELDEYYKNGDSWESDGTTLFGKLLECLP